MTGYVALVRAVNVGGTGKLPMAELKLLCEAAGFERVRTYIASGNVVFSATRGETEVKEELERRLGEYAGKPVGAMIRTAAEMAEVLAANPFPAAPPAKVLVLFLDAAPDSADMAVRHQANEEVRAGKREIYIYFPDGMGRSKLVISAMKAGTGRNINTVQKLAGMAAELS